MAQVPCLEVRFVWLTGRLLPISSQCQRGLFSFGQEIGLTAAQSRSNLLRGKA